MNKALFQFQGGQEKLNQSEVSSVNVSKKPRQKITLLDDIDQLNQIINGPGANLQNKKAEEVLLKTYQFMKGQPQQNKPLKQVNQLHKYGLSNKSHERSLNQQDKKNNQNNNNINLPSNQKTHKFQQQMMRIKGPRIIMTMKKIDLSKQVSPADFYLKNIDNFLQQNDGTRAPTNSVLQSSEGLFSKALTDRRVLVNGKGVRHTGFEINLRK